MKQILSIKSLVCGIFVMIAATATAQKAGANLPQHGSKESIMKSHPRMLYSHGIGRKSGRPTTVPERMAARRNPAKDEGAGTLLWGNIERSASWEEQNYDVKGVYSFHAQEGTEILPVYESWNSANGGAAYFDGVYHYVSYEVGEGYAYTSYYEYTVNTSSEYWDYKDYQYNEGLDFAAQCVAYDATDGKTYGFFYNSDATAVSFGHVTYGQKPLVKTVIAASGTDYVAMSVTAEGQLYAISMAGDLYKVDKANGSTQLVGSTGVIPAKMAQSAYIDPATGIMYWAAVTSDDKGILYTVDLASGTATKITDMPGNEEVTGLYVPEVSGNTPMAATALEANFAQGSTTGTLSFTMPVTSIDGTPLDGELEYKVVAGYIDAASGTASPGDRVTTDEMSLYSSYIDFKVTVSNSSGTSDAAYLYNVWIGSDQPSSPESATLTVDEKDNYKATVTWTPVTISENGGYMDIDNLKYYVERMPGNIAVAKAVTGTTVTDHIPVDNVMTRYYYKVYAFCGDDFSIPAFTNAVVYGDAKDVPYVNDFTEEGESKLFTVIDNNGDEKTWEYELTYFGEIGRYKYPRATEPADDWLVSPPVRLQADKLYKLVLHPYVYAAGLDDSFSVSYGIGDDQTAYTKLIPNTTVSYEFKNFYDQDPRDIPALTKVFSVDADGDYKFGIHAESGAYSSILYMNDFQLIEGPSFNVPDSVTNVKVVPASEGQLSATISFVTPSKNLRGETLTSLSKAEILHNGTVCGTIENPAVGTELSFVDNQYAVQGMNTYTVRVINEYGAGFDNEASAFIGIDVPLVPENVKLVNNGDYTATMTWDAPGSTGVSGGYVDVDALTYTIYSIVNDEEGNAFAMTVAEDITETSAIVDLPETDEQTGTMYLLKAKSSSGESDYAVSNVLLTGKPFPLPFHESFLDGTFQNGPWFTTQTGGSTFAIYGGMSADDEDGMLMYRPEKGEEATLSSGMISMEGAVSPELTYATFDIPGWGTTYDVMIELESTDTVTVKSVDYSTMEPRVETGDWAYYTIDLTPYKDYSYIRLIFRAKVTEAQSLFILDDINVTAEPNGISSSVEDADLRKAEGNVYDINGMRMEKDAKGLLIINSKKIVRK